MVLSVGHSRRRSRSSSRPASAPPPSGSPINLRSQLSGWFSASLPQTPPSFHHNRTCDVARLPALDLDSLVSWSRHSNTALIRHALLRAHRYRFRSGAHVRIGIAGPHPQTIESGRGRPPYIQDIVLPAALGLHQNPFPHHCPLMRLAFSSQKINGALHRGYRLHLSGEFPGWTAGAYRAAARRFLECLFATEPCTLRPSNFLDCTRPASRLRGETRAPGRKQINDTISFTSLDWAVPGPQMNETKRFCSHRGGHQFASAGRETRPTTVACRFPAPRKRNGHEAATPREIRLTKTGGFVHSAAMRRRGVP
jgi:hypothetical protein